ncbi:hypothetical protein A2870_03095 [Candidatus Curtissbacteria bacterium RIFCSPHIGHO2_01_FULL_41_11]|uniref:Uncharacterized protein n=1 Tax=Candidatus Curtissbacteria bacterium RIFCSPHIGHO2_01_FULL_41_11 TaxID=1797711 RepID=A0A1F5G732_9BACT|nr:MAG: hypothetical protein A2870_03095 [Candidatus Curtissbacteria bacterium RIFCSPHIGHO2_01_FULL_41_11]
MTHSPDLPKPQPSPQETASTSTFQIHYGLSRRVVGNAAKEILTNATPKPDWLTPQEITDVCMGVLSQLGYYLSVSSDFDEKEEISLQVAQSSVAQSESSLIFDMSVADFFGQIAPHIKVYLDSQYEGLSKKEREGDSNKYLAHRGDIARVLDFLAEQEDQTMGVSMVYHGDFEPPAYTIKSLEIKEAQAG